MCLRSASIAGVIYGLPFGDTILFKPEILYTYVDAIYEAAKQDPQGMGRIAEDAVLLGEFQVPEERIVEKHQEELLLTGLVRLLERERLVLRVSTGTGSYLVFPTVTTRDFATSDYSLDADTTVDLEGPILAAYSRLVVWLSGNDIYDQPELWKDTAVLGSKAGGRCGIQLEAISDQQGKVRILFDAEAGQLTRTLFRESVRKNLERSTRLVAVSEPALPVKEYENLVFICYNSADRDDVRAIAERLRSRDIDPWFDEWYLRAGERILDVLAERIRTVGVVLLFLGREGLGTWQSAEWHALMPQVIARSVRLIPIVLPSFREDTEIPEFLQSYRRVDFRKLNPDPLDDLVWGIKGERYLSK